MTSYEKWKEELMKDPEFRKGYDALSPKYQAIQKKLSSNYKRGARFEVRVKTWYEDAGYDAIRSAGSHGTVDVLAVLNGLWIANTLRLSNYWSPVEREEFEDWCKRNKCIGRFVWRDKGNKIQFKEVSNG